MASTSRGRKRPSTGAPTGDHNGASTSRNGFVPGKTNGTQITTHFQVEVRLKPTFYDVKEIRAQIAGVLKIAADDAVRPHSTFTAWQGDAFLAEHVDEVRICESAAMPMRSSSNSHTGASAYNDNRRRYTIHTYYAAPEGDMEELTTGDADGEERREDDSMAATVLELPNASLEGVWDSLIYEYDVKQRLLDYIHTTLVYSDANIDFNIISWNRLLLLHGPPGTGKTSLCRALAQKLAIRLSHRYAYGKLVEINSHSLFSKWFSESGKLVQKLFSMVTEMVADEDAFVVVLIDEVESLTASRSAAASGTEPGDAVRVVNALLTQLDKLKTKRNCLVVTTSNLSNTIDDAFLDRADIKQYIGPPPAPAIYGILRSCALELMRVGLIESIDLMTWQEATKLGVDDIDVSKILALCAGRCANLSGRTLRKLPVLAHARYLVHGSTSSNGSQAVRINDWLDALDATITDVLREGEGAATKP